MTTSFTDGLQRRRADTYQQAQALLQRARAEGREDLTPAETREYNGFVETMRGLTQHIDDCREDEARSGVPARYANLGR
ncbi:hypothetical protein [Mycobacterium sp.]|uniref:hypothetical protein n=1 Tax=Mycobacterium sp. TaxID=1785 RepID=UPI003F9D4015